MKKQHKINLILIINMSWILGNKEYPILMASFDVEADHDDIIVNKILPLINEVGLIGR
jgi:hypothetical protein